MENLEAAVNDIQSDFTITQNVLEEAEADQKDVSDDIKIIEHNLNMVCKYIHTSVVLV